MHQDSMAVINHVDNLLKGVPIPPRPFILTELMREKQNPNVNFRRIAEIISKDVAISGSIIKTINSPFWVIRVQVGSIFQAIKLLGMQNITNMVAGLSLKNSFKIHNSKFMDFIWKISLEVALISARLAKQYTNLPPDEFYSLGLFTDCGVPLLVQKFDNYSEIFLQAHTTRKARIPLKIIENQHFNISHCRVGHYIAKRWQLPEHICRAILYHHDCRNRFSEFLGKPNKITTLLAVLKISEHISLNFNNIADYYEWNDFYKDILKYLNIDREVFEEIELNCFELLERYYDADD